MEICPGAGVYLRFALGEGRALRSYSAFSRREAAISKSASRVGSSTLLPHSAPGCWACGYFASALGTRLLGLRVEQLVRPLQGGVQHPGSLVGRVGFLGLAEGLLLQCIQHFLPELAEHFEADEPRGYFFYQHGVFVGSQQFVRGARQMARHSSSTWLRASWSGASPCL